jgi:hypothetical protein
MYKHGVSLSNTKEVIFMRPFVLSSVLPVALSVFLVCAAPATLAAEISGIKFADTGQVDGQALLLNGLGVRYRAVFKVYAAGLYLPKKSQDEAEVLSMAGSKRIHAVMFREVDGDVLGKLLMQGIRDNNNPNEAVKHLNSIIKLGQVFAERKKLGAGDSFTIDLDAKTGPALKVNGKAIGQPLGDPSFNVVLLRIWLGANPADHLLKKGMLNQPTENKPQY